MGLFDKILRRKHVTTAAEQKARDFMLPPEMTKEQESKSREVMEGQMAEQRQKRANDAAEAAERD